MSFFAKSTAPPLPKTENSPAIALGLALIITSLVTAQLFSYEDFPRIIANMWIPGGIKVATILAAFIVIMEVFSLPFLLRMKVSPLMRFISMVAGWLVLATWIGLTFCQNITASPIGNAGLFGATISVPVGWWTTLVFVALAVLGAWVSWGMWPLSRKK